MPVDFSPPSDNEQLKDEELRGGVETSAADAAVSLPSSSLPSACDSSCSDTSRSLVTVSIADESTITTATSTATPSATGIQEEDEKSVAMEIDEAFRADPSGFAMSFEELTDDNQSDQLYADMVASAHTTTMSDNQLEHHQPSPAQQQTQELQAQKVPALTTTKQQKKSQAFPAKSKLTAAVPLRKSPRRATESKTASSKKPTATSSATTSGTKRTSSAVAGAAATTQSQAFSWNDILRVQNLIERCLQQYLSKNEIVMTLKAQANVEPSFTAVVWQKLEEQNPTFFRAYNLQLRLKEQITAFNYLVSQQKEMMAKASGNAAFMSFLSSSDSRNTQRPGLPSHTRTSRLAATAHARVRSSGFQTMAPSSSGSMTSSSTTSSVVGFLPPFSQGFSVPSSSSPMPLPSPIKTDLDTHAFFS